MTKEMPRKTRFGTPKYEEPADQLSASTLPPELDPAEGWERKPVSNVPEVRKPAEPPLNLELDPEVLAVIERSERERREHEEFLKTEAGQQAERDRAVRNLKRAAYQHRHGLDNYDRPVEHGALVRKLFHELELEELRDRKRREGW
jgi:hypothetical protein